MTSPTWLAGPVPAPLAALATGPDGRWQPGIGDPTAMGWVTVAAYLAAAFLSARAGRHHLRRALAPGASPALPAEHHARIGLCWAGLALVLLCLGVNKQLDLQTWLTELGRDLAQRQGWYEGRRRVQGLFIAAVAMAGAGGLALAARALRVVWPQVRLALVGLAGLLVFVVVRAASFHGLDLLLGRGPVHLNWVLELAPLALLVRAAWRAVPDAPARGAPAAARPHVR